jgi:hypothetical protein
LTNARAAFVSQNEATNGFKSADLTITLNGSTDLFITRSDSEFALDTETVVSSGNGERIKVGEAGENTMLHKEKAE